MTYLRKNLTRVIVALMTLMLVFTMMPATMWTVAAEDKARTEIKVTDADGKITCVAPSNVEEITAKHEKKFVKVNIIFKPGSEVEVDGDTPISINGVELNKYKDSLVYFSYPESDFDPSIKKTAMLDLYIYPEAWELIKKGGQSGEDTKPKENNVSLSLDITETDGKLISSKPDYADKVDVKFQKKNVHVYVSLKKGNVFDINAKKPIIINGIDISKYSEDDVYISYPETDFEPNLTKATVMDIYIYPDLWKKLNKSGPKEDEPTVKPNEQGKYKPSDYAKVYETEKVKLADLPIYEKVNGKEVPVTKAVKFSVYNSTTQQHETNAVSADSKLKELTLVKDNNYIISIDDKEYDMDNAYITSNKDGALPQNYKIDGKTVDKLVLIKRTKPADGTDNHKRVRVQLPVFYKDKQGSEVPAPNVKFKLTSPIDTVTVTSDEDGFIECDLIEDNNYMIEVSGGTYAMDSFPLTVKDKSEWNSGKHPYDHLSCRNVLSLIVFDKADDHKHDTVISTYDDNVELTGLNFGTEGKYALNERVLPNGSVKVFEGKDYEVVDIDTVNMARVEISKLAHGSFEVTRKVPAGKSVKQVYYIDEAGKPVKVKFSQDGDKVKFLMDTMSMYNNVIEYGSNEQAEYYVVNKDSLKWNSGDEALEIVVKAKSSDEDTYDNFSHVTVDGVLVSADNYTKTKGSLRLKFKSSYLKTLSNGSHTAKIYFQNGAVEARFTVAGNNSQRNSGSIVSASSKAKNLVIAKKARVHRSIVKTGDSNMAIAYEATLIMAIVALAGICYYRRKRV
ncbi:hypothetical protein [Mogibacterium diversum]|jgi:hypothetical protein|uniref:hypothetical protein n=1 Tax=Mogibacterium diversum TaxID=114527 RepID=UPI0027BAC931|nr:hypothetical protein [Mogibacterium diversum]